MNEELLLLMEQFQQAGGETQQRELPGAGRQIQPPEPEEVELTDDIRAQKPVVNRNRGGRITNATQFLANPEVQNALISFGQAFSNAGNFTGQPNPIDAIGNAGRELIQGQANQRALEASESGAPIAESAGRFASPDLVSTLQTRRQESQLAEGQLDQRQKEFEDQIDLQNKELDLRSDRYRQDAILERAVLEQDAEQFNQRYKLLEAEAENEKKISEARANLFEAQAKALAQGGEGRDDLRIRTNDFIELLNKQEVILSQNLNQLNNDIDRLEQQEEASVFNAVKGILPGGQTPSEAIEKATQQNIQANEEIQKLKAQRSEVASRLENIKSSQKNLTQVQTERLGGSTQAESDEAEQQTGEAQPQGTVESPVQVSSMDEVRELPSGSIVTNPFNPAEKLRINEDGTFDIVSE